VAAPVPPKIVPAPVFCLVAEVIVDRQLHRDDQHEGLTELATTSSVIDPPTWVPSPPSDAVVNAKSACTDDAADI
jgi:hypothetical protein